MKIRFIAAVAGAILLACAVNSAANATPMIFSSRTAFDAAAGGGLNVESFEATFAQSATVSFANGFSLSESITALGSPLWVQNSASSFVTHLNKSAFYSESTDANSIGELNFDNTIVTVNAVGFDIIRDLTGGSSSATDSVSIDVNSVSTNLTLTTGVPQFFGVIDTMAQISLITIDATAVSGSTFIDRVSFGPVTASAVPEPSTLALFGLGLAGLVVMRRRRRAA